MSIDQFSLDIWRNSLRFVREEDYVPTIHPQHLFQRSALY